MQDRAGEESKKSNNDSDTENEEDVMTLQTISSYTTQNNQEYIDKNMPTTQIDIQKFLKQHNIKIEGTGSDDYKKILSAQDLNYISKLSQKNGGQNNYKTCKST